MNLGKVLLGITAGVAVGVTLGVLFAPHKGSKTRRKIVERQNELTDDLENRIDEFISLLTKKYESIKERATHISETWISKPEGTNHNPKTSDQKVPS